MATDFFERQSDARRSTTWLVSMFALAVFGIVVTVVLIAAAVIQTQMPEPGATAFDKRPEQIVIPAIAGVISLVLILGGTAYKVFDLRSGGGTRVAESLGGRRLFPNTGDATERRLLNVVEEMALASGTPVPPVFLMEEPGINAFAAGYSPSDAVLGVTRGCAEQLTRDELQGVIAHEFSHVLNGDMRMSIRLIGVLHGILLIGLTGHLIMRTFFYAGHGRRRSNNKDGGQIILVIIAVGVAAIIIGFIGTFFGNLIKAAVSRQREYLADASAVQFTRNPSGIADALKRIGGSAAGSKLKAANARQASHMFFSQGVFEGFTGLMATHPPLDKRIRAIEPQWDGSFEGFESVGVSSASSKQGQSNFAGGGASVAQAVGDGAQSIPVDIVDQAIEQVGEPTHQHRHYAAGIIESLPEVLRDTVHEPYGARAVVYAMLLDRNDAIRKTQLTSLAKAAPEDIVLLVMKLIPAVDSLDARARLPLIDMSLPALKAMCGKQYAEFKHCFVELVEADNQLDLFEWMLSQVVMRHLKGQYEDVRSPRVNYFALQQLGKECSVLLSTVAYAGNAAKEAKLAFERGQTIIPEVKTDWIPPSPTAFDDLRSVLSTLNQVSVKHRGRLVDACAEVICADEHVTWQEAELLRGISDLLDCPMPPLLVKS